MSDIHPSHVPMHTEEHLKQHFIDCVDASILLSPTPCYVCMILLTGNGSGIADAAIYNGHDTTGEVKFYLRVIDDMMHSVTMLHPVYFNKGLYVNIGGNVEGVTIHYLPVPE